MREILFREHIRSMVISERSSGKDVIKQYQKQNFCGAKQVVRYIDNRETRTVVEQHPGDRKRPLRRFTRQLEGKIFKQFGTTLWRRTRLKMKWKHIVAGDVESIQTEFELWQKIYNVSLKVFWTERVWWSVRREVISWVDKTTYLETKSFRTVSK